MHSIVVISILLSAVVISEGNITCRDNNNNPVDWYIIYKLPVYYHPKKVQDVPNIPEDLLFSPENADMLEAMYKQRQNVSKDWPPPPRLYMDQNKKVFDWMTGDLNKTKEALYYTMQQAYQNHKSQDVGYVFYNDEWPISAGGKYTVRYGHTKGVTIFDGQSGLWLVHSVPKFPPPSNISFSYPSNAVFYGQHLLCISLRSAEDVSNVGKQLQHNEPYIYDSNLPSGLATKYPILTDVINKVKPITQYSNAQLHTPNNIFFMSMAKTAAYGKDLYADFVAPGLRCNLIVETWQHGSSEDRNLNASCSTQFKVNDAQYITDKTFNIGFRNYYDHSKFAVCRADNDGKNGWVCIGDINRQSAQLRRGGGTVCFYDTQINAQYLSFIGSTNKCS